MGYTAYRAWTTGATSINPETVALAKQGATLYTIQLVLNLMWTPLYFSLHQPIAATADILALGGTVAYLAYIWGQVDPVCGWLLAPYLGWLSFATYLCVCLFAASPDDGHNTDKPIGGKRPPEQLGLQADSNEKELARSSRASQEGSFAPKSIRNSIANGFPCVRLGSNPDNEASERDFTGMPRPPAHSRSTLFQALRFRTFTRLRFLS